MPEIESKIAQDFVRRLQNHEIADLVSVDVAQPITHTVSDDSKRYYAFTAGIDFEGEDVVAASVKSDVEFDVFLNENGDILASRERYKFKSGTTLVGINWEGDGLQQLVVFDPSKPLPENGESSVIDGRLNDGEKAAHFYYDLDGTLTISVLDSLQAGQIDDYITAFSRKKMPTQVHFKWDSNAGFTNNAYTVVDGDDVSKVDPSKYYTAEAREVGPTVEVTIDRNIDKQRMWVMASRNVDPQTIFDRASVDGPGWRDIKDDFPASFRVFK